MQILICCELAYSLGIIYRKNYSADKCLLPVHADIFPTHSKHAAAGEGMEGIATSLSCCRGCGTAAESMFPSFGDCASLVFLPACSRPLSAGPGRGWKADYCLFYYLYEDGIVLTPAAEPHFSDLTPVSSKRAFFFFNQQVVWSTLEITALHLNYMWSTSTSLQCFIGIWCGFLLAFSGYRLHNPTY